MTASDTGPVAGTTPVEVEEQIDLWREAAARLLANPLAVVGLVILLLLVFFAVFGPWVMPYDYLAQNLAVRSQPPSWAHPFGTDDLGRDVLSRVIYGARTALGVAVAVTAISLFIGVVLGSIAGFSGGRVDSFIMWLTDATMSLPSLLLVVVINTSLQPPINRWFDLMFLETQNMLFRDTRMVELTLVFGSLSLVLWPQYARLVRGQVLTLRAQPYVLAARALGLPVFDIVRRHVIPNALGPLIVAVSAGLGTALTMESAFSFLGLGVRPPTPSWGNMISEGLGSWRSAPYLLLMPALVLGVATVAFSFVGDGLNDALNPRRSGR